MSHNDVMRHPDRWLAVMRIGVGVWFIKAIWTKWVVLGGVLPVPMSSQRWIDTMPKILAGYANVNPSTWCRYLLEHVIIPNAELFAHLTAVGEGLIGIGLTFGLFTRFSALGGLFLMLCYEVAALGLPYPQHGLRWFFIIAMLAFFFARAGAAWGLDTPLARRFQPPPD